MTSGTLIVAMLIFISLLCVGIGVLIVRELRPAEETANAEDIASESFRSSKKMQGTVGAQVDAKTINPYQPQATDTRHLRDSGSNSPS